MTGFFNSNSIALQVADTMVAASALSFPAADGTLIYVKSVKDYFYLDTNSSTLTVDGNSILSTVVGGSNARLIRLNNADPSWSLRSAWFIDPVAGNDDNSGATSLLPLKTFRELKLRLGSCIIAQTTLVTIMGNLPVTDPISLKGVELQAKFTITMTAVTITRSGTITGLISRSDTTNTPWQITDTGMSGTWTTDLNRRIKYTSGSASGAWSWVAKDLGSNTARISEPASYTSGQVVATFKTPAINDTYNIEELGTAYISDLDVRGSQMVPGVLPQLIIQDMVITSTSTSQQFFLDTTTTVILVGCRFTQTTACMQSTASYYLNNLYNGLFFAFGGNVYADCGLAKSLVGTFGTGGNMQLDGHFMVQGGGAGIYSMSPGAVRISMACVFDNTSSFFNSTGAALIIGTTSSNGNNYPCFASLITGNHGTAVLWGSGNAGPGINVANGTFTYSTTNPPTITGTSDFILGGSSTSYPFDPATGTFNSGTAISNTWSNLAAALPTGFNHNAHNVIKNCKIYKI